MKTAKKALNKAETEATTERESVAFKSQSESIQSWIREQKQKLLSLGSHVPFEERLQTAQVSLEIRFGLKVSRRKASVIRKYDLVSVLYVCEALLPLCPFQI